MHQKKYPILIILLLTGMALGSCKKDNSIKDNPITDITSGDWVVVKSKKQESHTYSKAPNRYILKFLTDTTYSLKLDVNICGGNYEITNPGNIKIKSMACTEICCDSDFASDLMQLLPKMTEVSYAGSSIGRPG